MPAEWPPAPWHSFLRDLDRGIGEAIELHCLGGFVATMLYGLPRHTGDVDYLEIRPANLAARLQAIAGMNSPLHQKHRVYLQHVGVVTLPEFYGDRLRGMFPGACRNIRLFGLDPYDLALSKLERDYPVDRQDVKYLAQTVPLRWETLRERYYSEMRSYVVGSVERIDGRLESWHEEYFLAP